MKKLIFPLVLVVSLLSACAMPSDTELQTDGTGTDEMRKSPCAGADGSPCAPILYEAPGFTWVRV